MEFTFYVPYFYMWLADHKHVITTVKELKSFDSTPLRIGHEEIKQ